MLKPIVLPANYNYVGVFLTLDCNLCCSYCINRFGELTYGRRHLAGQEWLLGLNRIVSSTGVPITLQGGEPTLHPDFFSIANGIRPDLSVDLLTNLEIDVDLFMEGIPPGLMVRDAPYASIRVSFHPEVMAIEPLAGKVKKLLNSGYSVGIWGVLHPGWEVEVRRAEAYCVGMGIDFRTKEFLGEFAGAFYGEYFYGGATAGIVHPPVACRTTELIIGPDGDIYRCHSDLYAARTAIGNILDPDLAVSADFRQCSSYGFCNPCDVKLKTNRFQEFGHTSVEIRFDPDCSSQAGAHVS